MTTVNGMTIDDAVRAKKHLETLIEEEVNKFMETTGLTVESIIFDTHMLYNAGKAENLLVIDDVKVSCRF